MTKPTNTESRANLKATAAIVAAVLALVAFETSASARMCKRICSDGVCWSDCSKIPGQPLTRR